MTANQTASKSPIVAMIAVPVAIGVVALALSVAVAPTAMAFVLGASAIVLTGIAAWRVTAVQTQQTETTTMMRNTAQVAASGDRRRPTFDRQSGLLAEWYFRLRMEEEISRAKRYGHALTALALSPSRPENIEAVRDVARNSLRGADFAADLGGVIGVCLPDTNREGAQVVIDRIAAESAGIDIHVGEYPADGLTMDALLNEQAWRTRPVDDFQDEIAA
jgi:PleD family two-component response regulator